MFVSEIIKTLHLPALKRLSLDMPVADCSNINNNNPNKVNFCNIFMLNIILYMFIYLSVCLIYNKKILFTLH